MRDKRPIDELSIAELERILAIRKRDARQERARRYDGRRVGVLLPEETPRVEPVVPSMTIPAQPLSSVPAAHAPPAAVQDDGRAVGLDRFEDEEPRFEDELDRRMRPFPAGVSQRRRLWNRALLAIEVAAVLGLVYLFVTLFTSLQAVTQTTADIQSQFAATSTAQFVAQYVAPTATPALSFAEIVLPGGHIYDTASRTARFNLDEVPAQYRAAYQNQLLNVTPAAPPTRSPEAPLAIRIPAISVTSTIITGDSWDALQRGVGFHVGSANPGESGNMVLSAHDDVFGETFKDLPQLAVGDEIVVTTQLHEYTYVVESHEIVAPTDVQVMDNTRRDRKQATLITCYPYRVDSQRYIVHAVLKSS